MKFVMWSVLAAITTVLLASPSHGQKASATDGVDPLITRFWKLWDEKSPNAAILSLAARGKEGNVQTLADQISGAMSRMGNCVGRDEISRIVIGSRLVRVRYLLRFESQPLFLDITYYRADTQWRSYGFNFVSDENRIISEMAGTNQVHQNVADAR